MTKTKGRVVIPTDPKDLLELARKVSSKDDELGAQSVLRSMEGYNWPALTPTIGAALDKHDAAEGFKKQMEAAYRDRDNLLGPLDKAVRDSAAMLKAANPDNPKRLGDWGYEVDDTPPPHPKPEPKS